MMKEKAIMSWSGGKDSALALFEVQKQNKYDVIALQTTITQDFDRVSMHGFKTSLLERQSQELGIPLDKILINQNCVNEDYEIAVKRSLDAFIKQGITTVIFGDIYLDDLRAYREEKLAQVGLKAHFPLWKKDTTVLAETFIAQGFKAIITCVDTKYLANIFSGRYFDSNFLFDLPANIDPCGENGEFHSFVFEGPIFKNNIGLEIGDKVLRDERFQYCDLSELK